MVFIIAMKDISYHTVFYFGLHHRDEGHFLSHTFLFWSSSRK
ncbi:hypothetical protein J2S19_002350 [Metabacillus malikii]|uniref:Uncharacterized protein n=1 Tax=Metabacillus malikii TaxID=1504265 RepID=A0ABT9ZFM2_9BACI|nr:hypothetical protein [Metabacillus malikii]